MLDLLIGYALSRVFGFESLLDFALKRKNPLTELISREIVQVEEASPSQEQPVTELIPPLVKRDP